MRVILRLFVSLMVFSALKASANTIVPDLYEKAAFFNAGNTNSGTNYYLSSSEGNDQNDGSFENPWKSLSKISSVSLLPGDTVFFKKDERFDGHFVVNGSGLPGNPIVISSYGTGELPILTGAVGTTGGGDYQEAVFVENNDHLVFENLEIQNERKITRAGVDSVDAYGIYILNSGTRILKDFTFRNMTFRNVFAVKEMNDPDDFNGLEVAGLRIESKKNTVAGQEKNIQDVLMENCYFTNLQRLGVHIKHGGGNTAGGNDSINRNMNLVFRNNEFHHTGGTCILPTNTYNCLIEDNVFDHPGSDIDPRMPNRGSSVWTWRCFNTVIQKNYCLHIRGYLDSHGVHIDHENRNTFVQYNYMEDCEGGFVEILGGNVNAVYRYNISVNDGWRSNPNWLNSNHTIWINEKASGDKIIPCDSSFIYNNTIFIDSAYSTAIDIDATNTFIFNNIFYAVNGSNIGGKQVLIKDNGTTFFMSNNLYLGLIASQFRNFDANPVYGDPKFSNAGSGDKFGYQLLNSSSAANAGIFKLVPPVPGAGSGIFKNISVYPEQDIFGNPLTNEAGSQNIGACNAKDGNIITFLENKNTAQLSFQMYPVPAGEEIYLFNEKWSRNTLDIKLVSLQGKTVQISNNLLANEDGIIKLVPNENLPTGMYLVLVDNGISQAGARVILKGRY